MISKRLIEIANLVDKNKTVIDVGTDHAMLPCFLVNNKISNKVYASDNKVGPLKAATSNITYYHLEDKIFTILSDGLTNCPEDVDIVNINGMGYYTVEKILNNYDISRFDKLIIQINKHTDLLRKYISDHHYTILDEKIIKDDFYYEVVVFNCKYHDSYNNLEIEYGPINLKRKDQEFINYLKYQYDFYSKLPCKKYDDKLNQIKKIISK